MNARDEVLQRLRTALCDGTAPAPAPRAYRSGGTLVGRELADLLAERLTDYRAVVHRCTSEGLTATVTGVLRAGGVRALVLPPADIADLTDLTGWDGQPLRDDPSTPLTPAQLDAADAVLTGCAVAVAETGTLVLDAAPDQGRRILTLIPDHHLVVVHPDQIVQTVPEAVRRLAPDRPHTWISGPSATSDIELSRVEGVHGPRHLDVLLLDDGADPHS